MKGETAMLKAPKTFEKFMLEHPELAKAYNQLHDAAQKAGPLDEKTRALVKLGIAVGSRREGAVHSHVRKALDAGAKPEEIRHAVILGITTIGFPSMMAAFTWTNDILGKRSVKKNK